MRRSWNLRANDNPFYAIDASRTNWLSDDFYARGPALVAAFVDPALARLGTTPPLGRVLEIGCGMGRLFAALSERFAEVWGIDVSDEMVQLGKENCRVPATWLVGDGTSLSGVADASIDHVVSFEVLQHVPDIQIFVDYLYEIMRALHPGGTFQLHLRQRSDSLRQGLVRHLPRATRVLFGAALRTTGIMPVKGDIDTWLGSLIPQEIAVDAVKTAGFVEVQLMVDNLHPRRAGYWILGRKPRPDERAPSQHQSP